MPYIGEWNAASSDGEPRDGKRNARRWFDGSLEMDLPMRGLSEMFNVNYFLVSQVRSSQKRGKGGNRENRPCTPQRKWGCSRLRGNSFEVPFLKG